MLSHLSEPSSAKMSETSTYHILLVAVITPDLRATPKPTSTPSATPEVTKSDSQCGFRVFTRQAHEKLKPEVSGIEFATNMLTKAPHTGLRLAEQTITYYPQADGAPSKQKSLRDSWFRIKHILTYTPEHPYLDPGPALITLSITLMAIAQMGYGPGIHTSIKGGMRRNNCNNIHKKITLISSLCWKLYF